MFISYRRHKGKTAKNCCLLSDCSLKTRLSIKEGKYCSLQAYGSHQSRDELQGQAISCFTDECSEAQKENDPSAKKNPKPAHKYLFSQCQEGCAGSEHSCLTAAVEQELAPAKYWQKLSPGTHLSCRAQSRGFHFHSQGMWG